MRAWVAIVLLAGCSAAPPLAPDGPEAPLAGTQDASIHLLGAPSNGTFDSRVVVGRCDGRDNVLAYNISTSANTVRLSSPLAPPAAASFALAAFSGTPLAPHFMVRGGSELQAGPYHNLPGWEASMPGNVTVPVAPGADHLLLVIACRGQGTINYIVDDNRMPEAPYYLDATVATGFDNILAYVSDDPIATHGWSLMGQVHTDYENQAAQGVRIGETVISWSSPRPGWTHVACGHYGYSDHGIWKYDADLHGHEVHEQGFVQYELATIYLHQMLLFGDVASSHTAEGAKPGSFRFEVEHDASLQWSQTDCQGLHLGATLTELFGRPAATGWDFPNRFLEPSDIGGWPLDD